MFGNKRFFYRSDVDMVDVKAQAEAHKNKGNMRYKEGKYMEAIGCYSLAIGPPC